MDEFVLSHQQERDRMVSDQIERRGIHDARLLTVLRRVPRHLFVPDYMRDSAYEDCPLPIGEGQTISQPYIVALMTQILALNGDETVLEIGTGSGYQAAILGYLADKVHTLERIAELAERARQVLEKLGLFNVIVHVADGSLGWVEAAPYQAIMVTAAAPRPPEPLLQQLAEDGRLVIPVGPQYHQELQIWRRSGNKFSHEDVLPVAFVPLRGAHGWNEQSWF